jgi:hypothetical protein
MDRSTNGAIAMMKIALASAVMLASLFTVSVQADAAGFRHYHRSHAIHHGVKRHKVYKAQLRYRALKRYRHRHAIKRHYHSKRYHYSRRHW